MAGTAARPEELVARAVRYYRHDRLHITAQQLADRTAELGSGLSRQAISKIETGTRGVAVDELFTLAKALGVPPVQLLFPVEAGGDVEVIPGRAVDAWSALHWFTGEAPMPGDDPVTWETGAAAVVLRHKHDRLVTEWFDAYVIAGRLSSDKAEINEFARRLHTSTEDKLHSTRSEMRRRGLTPPELPGEMARRMTALEVAGFRVRDISDPRNWFPADSPKPREDDESSGL